MKKFFKKYEESPALVRDWILTDWWEKSFIGENPIERSEVRTSSRWTSSYSYSRNADRSAANYMKVCLYVIGACRLKRRVVTGIEGANDFDILNSWKPSKDFTTLCKDVDEHLLSCSTFVGLKAMKKKIRKRVPWEYEKVPWKWTLERLDFLNDLYDAGGIRGFQLLQDLDFVLEPPDDFHISYDKLHIVGLDHTWESLSRSYLDFLI